MNKQNTSDIYFAGFLICIGNPVCGTEKVMDKARGKEKTIFVFDIENEKFAKLKQDYFSKSGKVVAFDYMSALRNLKSMCFM